MSNESQIEIPESFQALYLSKHGRRLTVSREQLAQRYELCEDMAQLLTEPSKDKSLGWGVDEAQVLERTYRGLLTSDVLADGEPLWVVRRLGELLGWALPKALDWRCEED